MINNHLDRIQLHPEPDGGYTVTVPSLPGGSTFGETILEAGQMPKKPLNFIWKNWPKGENWLTTKV